MGRGHTQEKSFHSGIAAAMNACVRGQLEVHHSRGSMSAELPAGSAYRAVFILPSLQMLKMLMDGVDANTTNDGASRGCVVSSLWDLSLCLILHSAGQAGRLS